MTGKCLSNNCFCLNEVIHGKAYTCKVFLLLGSLQYVYFAKNVGFVVSRLIFRVSIDIGGNIMKTTKLLVLSLIAVFTVFGIAAVAQADDATSTQTVTFEVDAINEISVTGDPSSLVISTATAGSNPDSVTDTSSTYSITTNESSKKITAAIDSAMPDDVTLSVTLDAPTGATSAGSTSLSATAADVVTGISEVAETGLGIDYELDATVAAGTMSSGSRTVTFTLTDEG